MQSIKPIFLFLVYFFVHTYGGYADNRPDSFDIRHTVIHLSVRNFSAKNIDGMTQLTIRPKVPTSTIQLDLEQLTVDSVYDNITKVSFVRTAGKVAINLSKTYTPADSFVVSVYYHGKPGADPSGWGGFYFTGDYAFNLGVGFQVDPHVYGRAWFPTVDHFEERSTYEFFITTDSNYVALCNGLLQSDPSVVNGTKTWHWKLRQPIISYLACVSVSKFAMLKSTYTGDYGQFPLLLGCVAADTAKTKASFSNLASCIHIFENHYGPQNFDKIGYNMVPFAGGAMEHASNITFPQFAVDGTKTYETLMAHELSHHWWGNTITCKTPGDMWLNEGWASYSEKLFLEFQYSKQAYKDEVRRNHLEVLRFAHIRDAGARAVSGVPHDYTYGATVYKKGADMVHTLRSYMGDSAFFAYSKQFLIDHKFTNVSSDDLKQYLQARTTRPVNDFFTNWIFTPGFAHAEITSVQILKTQPPQAIVTIVQKPRFTDVLAKNLPMEVWFFDNSRKAFKTEVMLNNETDVFDIVLPFIPAYTCLDYDEKISDAISDRAYTIGGTGSYTFTEALMSMMVKTIPDTALVRVEHHWVGPDHGVNGTEYPFRSNYRYWSVGGVWPNGFAADATITYDGRTPSGGTDGYLDHTLIKKTEDSLVLLYRPTPQETWAVCTDVVFTYGNKTDKQGSILIKNIKQGDYVLAMYDMKLGIPPGPQTQAYPLTCYPNPTQNELTFRFDNVAAGSILVVTDLQGKTVKEARLRYTQDEVLISTGSWPSGIYTARLVVPGKPTETINFSVQH